MILLSVFVGVMFLAVVVIATCWYVQTERLKDARNDILELQFLIEHSTDTIRAADKLADLAFQAAGHRSSDSFTATVPHRQVEVARNDLLEKLTALARAYRVAKGEMKPPLEVEESEFRTVGPTFPERAPAEIKDESWRET